jgi:hypothetical protein
VEDVRAFIDRRATVLALAIPAAIAAKAIPGCGLAIATAIELAAVAGTVPFASARFLEMTTKTVDNAHRVSQLAADYERVGTEAVVETGDCGPAVTVVSTDLQQVSTSQDQVAANAVIAGRTTENTAWNVGASHGLVCAPTAAAVAAAITARAAAVGRMQAASNDLSAKLTTAAADYDATDREQCRNLDGRLPPR